MSKTEVPDIFYFVSIYHYIIDIIGQKSAAESISAMNHSHRGQRTPFCDIIRYKSFQAERGLLMAETFLILLDEALYGVVQISTTLLEFFGIAVLMATALKCFYFWLKKNTQNIRLDLAQGIALALEFKMGGEVLRTVVVREWSELGILGAIIVLRAMLTFLIHWEIKNEKKEG